MANAFLNITGAMESIIAETILMNQGVQTRQMTKNLKQDVSLEPAASYVLRKARKVLISASAQQVIIKLDQLKMQLVELLLDNT